MNLFQYYWFMQATTKRILVHGAFALFIFVYVLDYIESISSFSEALIPAALEAFFYLSISYFNLYVLLPKCFSLGVRKGRMVYLLSLIPFLIVCLTIFTLSGAEQFIWQDSGIRPKLSFSINFSLFVFISFFYWYVEKYRNEREKNLQLKNEKLQAEMNLLKSQVSPHFLFNSFNNLYALTSAKSDDAPRYIEALSQILRYLIYESEEGHVPIQKEIELIEQYITLEKIKKVKGMDNIRFSVDGTIDRNRIAPLLLISIVENAFKHGDIAQNSDGFIDIRLSVADQLLTFEVKNSTAKTSIGKGVGLTNLQQQLQLNYSGTSSLTTKLSDRQFSVHLTIPISRI